MPYTLRKTNGTTLAIIQDGAIDSSTDLVFVGKNYAGYGQTVNENFLKLLENFSGPRIPSTPLVGQAWFDTSILKLKVYDGNRFKSLTFTDVDNKRPSDLRQGDQWFDPVDQKLYVYNGREFVMIGPEKAITALQSQISGISVPNEIGEFKTVLQASIGTDAGGMTAVFSKESFVPNANSDINNNQHFINIQRGISLPGYSAQAGSYDPSVIGAVPDLTNQWVFFGAASSAWGMLEKSNNGSAVQFYDAKEYIRRSIGDSLKLNGALETTSNDGIVIGTGKIVKLHVESSYGNTTGNLTNLQGQRLNFNIQTSNVTTNALAIDYANGAVIIVPNSALGATSAPTGVPVDLGTETNRFRAGYIKTVYASALTTSTSGTINGTWTLGAGSSIVGGSVQATTAATATNAINLQSSDNTSYVHAKLDETGLSIAQRQSDGTLTVNGVNAGTTGTSKFYGNWQVGLNATVQATTLLGTNTSGYVAADTAATNNSIVQRDPTAGIVATKATIGTLSAGALETSIGYISGAWQLSGASTLEATYADLAERYEADSQYSPGTVLVIGGLKEITTTDTVADVRVAGIVSTNPAYKLNSSAGDDITHPYIALKGRVPCNVVGNVVKSDRLVTSRYPGYGQAWLPGMPTDAIFAIALEDFTGDTGVIEVMVK